MYVYVFLFTDEAFTFSLLECPIRCCIIYIEKDRLNCLDHYKHIRIHQAVARWQLQHEISVRLLVRSLGSHKLFVRSDRGEKRVINRQQVNMSDARGHGQGEI